MEYWCIIIIDIIAVRLYDVLYMTIGSSKTLYPALNSCYNIVCICKLARFVLMYNNAYEIVDPK